MIFNYVLSASVAFIIFGCIFNIFKNVDDLRLDSDDLIWAWFWIAVAPLLWFISVPISIIILVTLVLKFLTDKISQFILKKVFKK